MGGFLIIVNFLIIALTLYFAWAFSKSNIKVWTFIAFIYFCWSLLNVERVKWITYMEQELGNLKVKVEFTDQKMFEKYLNENKLPIMDNQTHHFHKWIAANLV